MNARSIFWRAAPLAILALAFALRMTGLLQIEHNIDRAYPVWQALMTLERGALPLTGQQTSVLFANPALTGYLLLPSIAVSGSALGAVLFTIALNTLGVWFTWLAGRAVGGARVGLIAMLFAAFNPWLIEYSRHTWVQGLLPFLVPFTAWALWTALDGARRPARRLAFAWAGLIVAAHTYLLAFALVAPFGAVLLLNARRILADRRLVRVCVIGGLAFALSGAVFGAALLSQGDVGAQLSGFSSGGARLSGEALGHGLRLVSGWDYPRARGIDAPIADSAIRAALTDAAHLLISACIALGAGLALLRAARGDRRGLYPLLGFAVPIALMSYVSQVVHPFYLLIGIPGGAVLAGIGLDALIGGRRAVAALAGALLIAFAGLSAINSARHMQETAHLPGAHGLSALSLEYGLPLGDALRAMHTGSETVISPVSGWIATSLAGHAYDILDEARLPDVLIVPPGGALVVRSGESIAPLPIPPADSWRLALPDGVHLAIDRLIADAAPDDGLRLRGEDGIVPIAIRAVIDADGARLITLWRVTGAAPAEALFAPFAHLFNARGERVAVIDGGAIPGWAWRIGDLHLHTLHLNALSAGTYQVQVGMYDGVRGRNAIFITPDGTYTPTIDAGAIVMPQG
jgi:hypothetical protein